MPSEGHCGMTDILHRSESKLARLRGKILRCPQNLKIRETGPSYKGGVIYFPFQYPSIHLSISPWFPFSKFELFLIDFLQILPTHVSGLSGLGLLIVKFCRFLTELSALHTSIFLFPEDNLGKFQ